MANDTEGHLWSVGEVAKLAGITVRTLHHWDSIGLVSPQVRSAAGYRLYGADDLALVHRVVVFRELGMSLEDITSAVINEGSVQVQLHKQADLLDAEIRRLEHRKKSVERMIAMDRQGISLTPAEAQEIFGDGFKPEYQEEAYQRWGDTAQWEQSTQRAAAMDKEDWKKVKADMDALNVRLGEAKRAGVDPGSDEAAELAEAHRASIGQFYDCSHSMHALLGCMYTTDERFTATYDAVEPGLAVWLREAIEQNARRHGVDPETATWE